MATKAAVNKREIEDVVVEALGNEFVRGEVQKITLADILERDAEKIASLKAEVNNAKERLKIAVAAYHAAIHYADFAEEVEIRLVEDHEEQNRKYHFDHYYEPTEEQIETFLLKDARSKPDHYLVVEAPR